MPYPEENQSMHARGTILMFVLHYDKLFFVTKKARPTVLRMRWQTFIPKFVLDLVRLPSHVAKLM